MNKEIKRKKNNRNPPWKKTQNQSRFTHKELKVKKTCLDAIIIELVKLGYEKELANRLVNNCSFNEYYNELIRIQDIDCLMWVHHCFYPQEEAERIDEEYRGDY
jgi:Holliday junction resolvasome RuvABC DNA-binding subunit